jgi:ATP-dependent Lon protease
MAKQRELHVLAGSGSWNKQDWERRVNALNELLMQIYGPERLVLRAGRLRALKDLRSDDLGRRVLALEKLIYDDPSIAEPPEPAAWPEVFSAMEEELAEMLARKSLEDDIEKRVGEKMQERHDEYLRDIRLQILKDEAGPETAETLKKLEYLKNREAVRLQTSGLAVIRPQSLAEVRGQDAAVAALLAKLGSPYPQHVLLFGPPGVGKTTVARLAFEEIKRRGVGVFGPDAPFVEVDGATLRWDPREVTNPLLGSVHDPIYQGARRDLADGGIPEPKLGLVTEAHGGILFIDEIGEMDPLLQNKLLKVLEDKRVQFDSPYYDPDDPAVPQYVRYLFEHGAPADFVLVGATTRSPEELSPALLSRCAEVYFDPLPAEAVAQIAKDTANRLGVKLDAAAADLISTYTLEGRRAAGLVLDAFSHAYQQRGRAPAVLDTDDIRRSLQSARLTRSIPPVVRSEPQVGRILGLAVAGFQGVVLEVEAAVFPARESGRGRIRFNETAGSMARDSVFNAGTVLRLLTGQDLGQYDVHVNVVGGGNIDGPSAGLAIFLAIYSALTNIPLRGDVAVTGELSLRGQVEPVGGIPEKVYGARVAKIPLVVVPKANAADVPLLSGGPEVRALATVQEVLDVVCA